MKKKTTYGRTKGRFSSFCLLISVFLVMEGYCSPLYAVDNSGTEYEQKVNAVRTVKEVFGFIEQNSHLVFLYSKDVQSELEKKVSMNMSGKKVEEILKELSSATGLDFKINNRQVTVAKKFFSEPQSQVVNQEIKVTGQVFDDLGETIPGANVTLKGNSSVGTVTDLDGNFTLSVPQGSTLVVSFIGYAPYEYVVKGTGKVVIKLVPDSQALDEVVVVGYGMQRKSSITGSISSIKSDKLKDVTSPSAANMLQGKVAGVVVTPTSGQPGSGVSIRVRGLTSIRGNQEPLWVIDGVAADNSADLNPNDIETISILKDGSATALYGSRGANGVIQVTTKRGSAGTSQVDASVKFGVSELQRGKLRMMNGSEYYDYLVTAFSNAGILAEQHWLQPYLKNQNFDWWDAATQSALMQNYNLSYKFGNDKVRSYIGADYYTEDGAIKGYDYDRFTVRANTDYVVNKRLTLKSRFALSYKETFNQQHSLSYASYTPWDTPYDSKGNLKNGKQGLPTKSDAETADPRDYWYSDGGSNYLYYLDKWWGKTRSNAMDINLGFEYKFFDWLIFESNNQVGFDNYYGESYYDPTYAGQEKDHGQVSNENSNNRNMYFTQTLRLLKTFGEKHSVNAYVGYEYLENRYWTNRGTAKNIYPNAEVLSAGAGDMSVSGGKQESKSASIFSKAIYTYDDKYKFEASFRRDGSSRLGPDKRWANFWAIGGGWSVHKEKFMENLNFVNELKPRFSYGVAGNLPSGAYEWTTKFDITKEYANEIAFYSNYAGNPYLSWEETNCFDFGLDIRLFDRIGITFDTYVRKTKNLIYLKHMPAVTGYNRQTANNGKMENKGYEISITPEILKTKQLYWDVTFNLAYNQNKITYLPDGNELAMQAVAMGYPYQNWYMREWAGVDAMTGTPLWFVVNSETGEKTVTGDYNKATRQLLDASPTPKYNGSVGTNFSWKGLSLNANFTFSTGAKIYNSARAGALDRDATRTTQPPMRLADGWSRWEKPGDIATHPQLIAGGNNNADNESTRYLENGDYFKLKTITLSYSLPEKWLKPLNVRNAVVSIGGENLFTITKFSGIDPEVLFSSSYNGVASSGNSYPSVRRFT
ncbi:MAG: TonB-dependent receptor, partial [Bacteroides sp.]|nr:TonB-dependent receptor [Bacteroides sp.]